MSGYICLKKSNFNGVNYVAGDIIPADAVLPSRVPTLLRLKLISEINSNEYVGTPTGTPQNESVVNETESWVSLPIKTKDGVLELPVSREDIVKVAEIMQLNADDAAKAIESIETDEVLIAIDAIDSRKTVKSAAQKRAATLAEGKEDTGNEDSQDGEPGTDESQGDE